MVQLAVRFGLLAGLASESLLVSGLEWMDRALGTWRLGRVAEIAGLFHALVRWRGVTAGGRRSRRVRLHGHGRGAVRQKASGLHLVTATPASCLVHEQSAEQPHRGRG